jgi:FHS family L-fucose permease-like MFS transporter
MALLASLNTDSFRSNDPQTTDVRAMAIATTLFFMWGFLTCLNDILIPHLKAIFELSCAGVAGAVLVFLGVCRVLLSGRQGG